MPSSQLCVICCEPAILRCQQCGPLIFFKQHERVNVPEVKATRLCHVTVMLSLAKIGMFKIAQSTVFACIILHMM